MVGLCYLCPAIWLLPLVVVFWFLRFGSCGLVLEILSFSKKCSRYFVTCILSRDLVVFLDEKTATLPGGVSIQYQSLIKIFKQGLSRGMHVGLSEFIYSGFFQWPNRTCLCTI